MTERPIILPLLAWLTIVGLVIAGVVALASCKSTPLPDCPPIMAREVVTRQFGPGWFMDQEDLTTLRAHIDGLRDGTCRSVVPEERGA